MRRARSDPATASASRAASCTASRTTGASEARFLAIISPGLFGPSYFSEINEVLAASAGGPPDFAAMGEVMRRHGLTPA